jgi:hypothetical protein
MYMEAIVGGRIGSQGSPGSPVRVTGSLTERLGIIFAFFSKWLILVEEPGLKIERLEVSEELGFFQICLNQLMKRCG